PPYFCSAVMLPLALMSAAVYLPPGVRYSARALALSIRGGMAACAESALDLKKKRNRSPAMRVLGTASSTSLPGSPEGHLPANCEVFPLASSRVGVGRRVNDTDSVVPAALA